MDAGTPSASGLSPDISPEAVEGEVEEHRLQGSPQATDTNAALRALSRAARSFLIYDSHNEAIRQFLSEFERAMRQALAHGPIHLVVRPFELVLDGARGREVVYVQRERDKSLAFRLYRDGVRRLDIDADAEWSELLRLLEILSIRYTGVRQHEDDIVTLLWKAGFQHIEAVAVEGFVLAGDEDDDEGADSGVVDRRSHQAVAAVPLDWDRPHPTRPGGDVSSLAWRPLPDRACEALHHEVSSRAVGSLAVGLCTDMLRLVGDPTDPTAFTDVAGLLDEVRTLLMADGQLSRLLQLARAVAELQDAEPEAVDQALRRFTDARALGRILHSAARGDGALPPELDELLDLVPGDHLESLLMAMAEERGAGSRALAGRLVEREVRRRPESVAGLVPLVAPELGGDLLRALARVDPERAVLAAREVVALDVPEFQGELLRLVREVPDELLDASTLLTWLVSPVEATRTAVLSRIGRCGTTGHYIGLKRHLDELPHAATMEAMAVGAALAAVAPDRALEELGEVVRPRSILGRVRGTAVTGVAVWAGVAGLGALPGEYPETAIRWRMDRAGEALYQHCQRTLHQRRVHGTRGAAGRLAEGEATLLRGPLKHPGKLVLTPQMLCFTPARAIDRWLGATDLDLPTRTVDTVEVDDGVPQMTVTQGETVWRFTGPDVVRIGTALTMLIGGSTAHRLQA